ncbi:sulfite exporter TauE/SafE family protein [Simiduia agarivorans]|uniref:Probable membrane transporter protein n=1 Tax=Simiduia agarivorans (strain DSM 21679 / JCM 13881 / BCRC 17597 / SA1) TaxID=1117647 RepID=K4KHJ5_SIMAS|nr:sulfite exporter TauE/SafE family protein [Simiduia agarivorans]AFU97433.1 hypothetical protein M5M_01000 [Simiduia agarivorans SA1 = DSM 21679]
MAIEWFYLLLLITGFIAGIINTLAGGGSNLTVPALMVLGMPADVANATNRVGVFFQSLSASAGFAKRGKLPRQSIIPVLLPTLCGGLVGAGIAAIAPVSILKPLLLGTMITMAVVMLVSPGLVAPEPHEQPRRVTESPLALFGLFAAGVYGGFVQAGVGFVLLAAIAGGLRYDLVRANALKVLCALGFTGVALVVFIADGLVQWLPGLALAASASLGAAVAVKWSLNVSQRTLKWFLLVMTLAASAAAMLS